MNASRLIALAAVAAALVGCASPRLDAQWSDPTLPKPSLRGARVLVACEAHDLTLRRLCQDALLHRLAGRGAVAVPAADIPNPAPGQPLPEAPYLGPARVANASAVLAATVALADVGVTPPVSIGLGGFGIGSGRVQAGVGVSLPIGGGRPTRGYSSSVRLIDTASGRVLWSAQASAPPSADVAQQLQGLARTLVDAAASAGFF